MNYGIQLYSVRDIAGIDLESALRGVASLGYETVEPAGFFGHSAGQVKEWLDRFGLRVSGAHAGFVDLEENFEGTVRFHKTIGNTRYILPGVDTGSREALDLAVAKLRRFAPMLEAEGITLGYHNHSFEFLPNADGILPLSYLAEKTDVRFEIDTFWAFAAHRDPLAVLKEYRSRLIGCIHLKDGVLGDPVKGTALGEGEAPLQQIIRKAKEMNLEMIVESEGLQPTGLEEVARCAAYLRKNG